MVEENEKRNETIQNEVESEAPIVEEPKSDDTVLTLEQVQGVKITLLKCKDYRLFARIRRR